MLDRYSVWLGRHYKHVLSHCSSPVVLDRYKKRHDVLSILASWVKGALKDGGRLYVDLSEGGYRPLGDIFESLRPDLAIVYEHSGTIATLELTVCHETNLAKSNSIKIRNMNYWARI